MGDDMPRQLRLSVIGFDGRAEESFKIVFKGLGKGKAILVDDGRAEGGIVNMDNAAAKALWASYRERHPNMPTIILGVNDPGIEGVVYVKKPATVEQMLQAVDRLISDLDQYKPAIPMVEDDLFFDFEIAIPVVNKPQQAREIEVLPAAVNSMKKTAALIATEQGNISKATIFYNPRDYLQSGIHSAIEYSIKHQVAVELWVMAGDSQWGKMIFMPGLKKVLTSFSDGDLKRHCSTPLTLLKHKLYRREPKYTRSLEEKMSKEQRGTGYIPFLWKIALYTSVGRLPEGTDLATATKLKHWPNLTRLYPVGGAMRITALLVEQPRPLPVVARVLNIPATRVYSFYSAACAIDIVESGERITFNEKSVAPKKHRDHTLFGQILKRLRTDKSELEA